jgi:molecular chaperone GrpE (heat shock protein)
MNNIKVVRADMFLEFAENMETALEVLSSEVPIDSPWRQNFERTLKQMRDSIAEIRGRIQSGK